MALPGLAAAGAGLVVAVALVEAAGLLAGGGETAGLAVLVDGVDDPVDAGVLADGLVLGVDEDDLVVLVGRVLVDPVGVEDAQVGATTTDTLLSGDAEGALVLQLVDTLVGGLACNDPNPSASHSLPSPIPSKRRIFFLSSASRRTYRRWHPWGRGACGHRGGRGRGR